MIAVWGLESEFGRFAGVRPTVPTLATLAYDPRRGAMFRNELFSALEIVNRGDIELERLKGSWAGALGQPQFMPSSYLRFAQDFDGDGRRDIWSSPPDVFASIAYYLQQHGWQKGLTWAARSSCRRRPDKRWPRFLFARRAAAPTGDDGRAAALRVARLGLRTISRQPLPGAPTIMASLIRDGSRAFLVYGNYEALLDYNCAHWYALSVALLADRIPSAKNVRRAT